MNYSSDITGDAIALALSHVAHASALGDDADDLAQRGEHSAAGHMRGRQRAAMKSAEVQIGISQAVSLQRIAEAVEREALRR